MNIYKFFVYIALATLTATLTSNTSEQGESIDLIYKTWPVILSKFSKNSDETLPESLLKNPEDTYLYLFKKIKSLCELFHEELSNDLNEFKNESNNQYDQAIMALEDFLNYATSEHINIANKYSDKSKTEGLENLSRYYKEKSSDINEYIKAISLFQLKIINKKEKVIKELHNFKIFMNDEKEYKSYKEFLLNNDNLLFFQNIYETISSINGDSFEFPFAFNDLLRYLCQDMLSDLIAEEIEKTIQDTDEIEETLIKQNNIDKIINIPCFKYLAIHYRYQWTDNKNHQYIELMVHIKPALIEKNDKKSILTYGFNKIFYIDSKNRKVYSEKNF